MRPGLPKTCTITDKVFRGLVFLGLVFRNVSMHVCRKATLEQLWAARVTTYVLLALVR